MTKDRLSADREISSLTSNPKKIGERIKRVRNLANLSRIQMNSDGDISPHTLSGWENGRFGGLTYAGAVRIVKRIAKEGVHCTVEWLLNEIGTGPTIISDYNESIMDISCQKSELTELDDSEEEKQMMNELLLFKQQNKNSAEFIVEDDAMSPHYNIGDYVAGKKRYKDEIQKTVGLACIVQTTEGKIFLRTVMNGKEKNFYHLVCNNAATKTKEPIIYNATLVSSAPIIWHRRKDLK